VVLTVTNIEKSTAFYTNLGFVLHESPPARYIIFGNVTISICESKDYIPWIKRWLKGTPPVVIQLETSDFEAAKSMWDKSATHGGSKIGTFDAEAIGSVAKFMDPDGHVWGILVR
jgi:predicted lactoylglutathione lyase